MWGGQSCPPTSFPAGRAAWKGGCGHGWPPHEEKCALALETDSKAEVVETGRSSLWVDSGPCDLAAPLVEELAIALSAAAIFDLHPRPA